MTNIRCAVIGTGHLGKIHAGLLRKRQMESGNVELAAVIDSEPSRCTQVAAMFHAPAVTDYLSIIDQIDAAVIATPTVTHFEIAAKLLQAGKHCLVEKPLACDAQQCKHLNELAQENRVVLQVGHVENFNPVWRGMRPQLRNVKFIDAVRSGTYTGRSTDIGIVMDLMIHDLDLIADLVDSTIERVTAFGFSVLSQHEDFAEAHIRFRNGVIARVRASRLDEHLQRTMTTYTSDMIATLDFANGTAKVSELGQYACADLADALPYDERLKVKENLFTEWMPTREVSFSPCNAIEQELIDFTNSIEKGVQPMVCGTRATRAVTLAEQVLSAIAQHKDQSAANLESQESVFSFPLPPSQPIRFAA